VARFHESEKHLKKGSPMKVECPKCKAVCTADKSKIPDKGIYGRCPKCQNRFFLRKGDGIRETPPEPEKMACPNCRHERNPEDVKCPKCGIIHEKYERIYNSKNLGGRTDRIEAPRSAHFVG
jgi:predicted Zn finger-like uncharacterized protein